jgi:hydroxymethylglutaryl-CoA synthase
MGGTYSGSTFLALMGLVDTCDDLHPGDRVAIFSYGSGSCGEFYSAVIGPGAKSRVAAAGLQGLLDQRQPLGVEEYEALERERYDRIDCADFAPATGAHGELFERRYRGKPLLTLKGIAAHYREYGWA